MGPVYGESSGREYALGEQVGQGGGGRVFAVAGADLVCKLPDPTKVDLDEALARVRHFAQSPVGPPAVAVLEAVSESKGGRPVGFVMKRVQSARALGWYFEEAAREEAGLDLDFPDLVRLAARLCRGVDVFHRAGVVIADFHDKQVLVDRRGDVHFLEPDGWELGLRIRGVYRWLRSGVGVYDYAPPEHQNAGFGATDRSVESDRWALAVLVWQLLKGGVFPHQVCGDGVCGPDPTELVRDGIFPHDPQARLPAGFAAADEVRPFAELPPEVRRLFLRCFVAGAKDAGERPTAEEWAGALARHADSLSRGPFIPTLRWPPVPRRALLAAAGVLLAGAAVAAAFLGDPAPGPAPAGAAAPPPRRHAVPFKNPPEIWSDKDP